MFLHVMNSRKEWLSQHFETEEGFRFWRCDNKLIELWSNKVIDQKINYIHQNRVEEDFVFKAEDYVYSSAIDYAGEKGMLDVIVIKKLKLKCFLFSTKRYRLQIGTSGVLRYLWHHKRL